MRLASIYHPERYAEVELPPEVAEYLEAMTRRIHTAFTELVQLMDDVEAKKASVAAA